MAEDQPQQPMERRDNPSQQPVERRDEAVRSHELRKGIDSMGVAPPVPLLQLPAAAQAQATAGGDGASPQGSVQNTAPVDYDG